MVSSAEVELYMAPRSSGVRTRQVWNLPHGGVNGDMIDGVKCLIGLVFAGALLAEAPNTPFPNRAPLPANVFYALPLGVVKMPRTIMSGSTIAMPAWAGARSIGGKPTNLDA